MIITASILRRVLMSDCSSGSASRRTVLRESRCLRLAWPDGGLNANPLLFGKKSGLPRMAAFFLAGNLPAFCPQCFSMTWRMQL